MNYNSDLAFHSLPLREIFLFYALRPREPLLWKSLPRCVARPSRDFPQPFYAQQHSPLFGEILAAAKKRVDPKWVLNPGVLLSEEYRE